MSAFETPRRPLIEPEVFLKRYREGWQKETVLQGARDAVSAHWQASRAMGVDLIALKMLEKLRKLKPAEAQRTYDNIRLYQRLLGLNFLEQGDLFDGQSLSTEVTAAVNGMAALIRAEQEGYEAGRAGTPGDHEHNPYRDKPGPGSEVYAAWMNSWRDGAADRSPKTITDIEPRPGGERNPEDPDPEDAR
jgi:ribosome modulation factor